MVRSLLFLVGRSLTCLYSGVPVYWINASRMRNFVTGGDDVIPGMVNVPPEALRLAVTSYVVPGVSSQLIDRAFDVLAKKAVVRSWN